MWKNIGLDKCASVIRSQFRPKGELPRVLSRRPTITISRMTGAGGYMIASDLVDYMQKRLPAPNGWTVFDQNSVEKVLEDHHIQKFITEFMEERHKSMLEDSVEEWMGLHPCSWTVVQWINATILGLAQIGDVIIIGRGSTVIAAKVSNAFHVRLVGSLEKRIEYTQFTRKLDYKEAVRFIKKRDEGRRRYFKDNFGADIDNPLLYHMIINTDKVPYEHAAMLIGEAVVRRFEMHGSRERSVSTQPVVHQ